MDRFKNIEIKNFRGIDHLKIDDFSRVNILLGQNSSGKSSVIQAINTETDLRTMLTEVIGYLGWAFHPDEPMTEYVQRDTSEPSYTQNEAQRLDILMDEAFDFCEQHGIDIYELSIEINKELHGDIFAEKEVA